MPGDIYEWSIEGLESHAKHWDCDPGDNGEMLNKVRTHSAMLLTGSPCLCIKETGAERQGEKAFLQHATFLSKDALRFLSINNQLGNGQINKVPSFAGIAGLSLPFCIRLP